MSDGENDATRNGRHALRRGPHGRPDRARPGAVRRRAVGAILRATGRRQPPPMAARDRRSTPVEPRRATTTEQRRMPRRRRRQRRRPDRQSRLPPEPARHHRAAPEDPGGPSRPAPSRNLPIELQTTQVIDDLGLLAGRRRRASGPRGRRLSERRRPDEFDTGSTIAERREEPKRRRRPLLLAARSMAALVAVLALAMTGGAWQWSTSKNARLNTISALDPNSSDILDPGGQYGDENFLIVGIDSRAGDNANMGAGDHRRRRRRALGHRHAGQHPGQPQTRGGGVVPARPGDHPDAMRSVEPRNRQVRTALRPEDQDLRPEDGLHRDQTELGVRLRRPEVPGEGNPEAVRLEHQPLHRRRLLRVRQNGRRPRRRRGVLQHAAARLRVGHGPRTRSDARSSTAPPH